MVLMMRLLLQHLHLTGSLIDFLPCVCVFVYQRVLTVTSHVVLFGINV